MSHCTRLRGLILKEGRRQLSKFNILSLKATAAVSKVIDYSWLLPGQIGNNFHDMKVHCFPMKQKAPISFQELSGLIERHIPEEVRVVPWVSEMY